MKAIILALLSSSLLFISMAVFAWYTKTMFVLDMPNLHELPRNFRVMNDLPHMKIAGGGQYSQAGFSAILERLQAKQITVVDLRQESHGFLNGQAVSWYGVHNADNAKKTVTQIEADQARLLAQVASKKQVKINRITQKSAEGRIEKLKPFSVPVQDVISEAAWLNGLGHRYFRIYVQDYHAPTAIEVDRFLEIVKAFPGNQWIYFHCRAGIGRTTVFMTIYDMMLHAKKTSFNDIMDRQVAAGGKDLRKLMPKSHYKYQWHLERLQFLKDFYQYAHDNKDHFQTPFSQWQASAK